MGRNATTSTTNPRENDMDSCYDLILQFNDVSRKLPDGVHNKIMAGEPIPVESVKHCAGQVRAACDLWKRIQERLNLIPQYETMLQ